MIQDVNNLLFYVTRSCHGLTDVTRDIKIRKQKKMIKRKETLVHVWVCGVMVLDVGREFRDRGSIPSEY